VAVSRGAPTLRSASIGSECFARTAYTHHSDCPYYPVPVLISTADRHARTNKHRHSGVISGGRVGRVLAHSHRFFSSFLGPPSSPSLVHTPYITKPDTRAR
jgi:hypothetical protein